MFIVSAAKRVQWGPASKQRGGHVTNASEAFEINEFRTVTQTGIRFSE